jgi:hypothetical protein
MEQQADLAVRGAHPVQQLLTVPFADQLARLDLRDDGAFDDEIGPEGAKRNAVVPTVIGTSRSKATPAFVNSCASALQ